MDGLFVLEFFKDGTSTNTYEGETVDTTYSYDGEYIVITGTLTESDGVSKLIHNEDFTELTAGNNDGSLTEMVFKKK